MGLASEGSLPRDPSGHLETVTADEKLENLLDNEYNFERDAFDVEEQESLHSVKNGNVFVKDRKTTNGKAHTNNGKDRSYLDKGPPTYRSQRYIMAYLVFGGLMNVFYQRICFSITIICMVNHTAIRPPDDTSFIVTTTNDNNSSFLKVRDHAFLKSTNVSETVVYVSQNVNVDGTNNIIANGKADNMNMSLLTYNGSGGSVENEIRRDGILLEESCDSPNSQNKEENEDGPLLWEKSTQGILLGAVYWTYLVTCVPGSFVVDRYRKKNVVMVTVSVMTLTTLLTHGASLLSPWLVFCIKLVQGLCTAIAILALYGLWSKWAPPQERSSLISLSFSGTTFANATVFPMSGLLCKYGPLGGWPSVFYFYGIVGIMWLLLVFFLVEESPSEHPRITSEECDYIVSSLADTTGKTIEKRRTPWTSILRSPAVWAIILGQLSFTWGLFLFLSTLPLYMFEILKMDIQSNGLYSMCPYVAFFVAAQLAGQASDSLIRRGVISVIWMRRLCNIISNIIPAILLIAISFLDCTQSTLAIGLLTVAVGATGFTFSYILVNPYDIAPRFAGQVVSVSNMASTICGIVTPYFVTMVTKDKTHDQWQIVFFVTAAMLVFGTVTFCLMSSATVQPWAQEEEVTLIVKRPDGICRSNNDRGAPEVDNLDVNNASEKV